MTDERLTVTIAVDAENCMDVRNASMYCGIGTMQIRKYCKDGLAGKEGGIRCMKRTALDDPKGADGRVKYFIPRDALDTFLVAREARRAARGTRISGAAARIKSVRKMVTDSDIDPDRQATTVEVLNELLHAAIAEQAAKQEAAAEAAA